MVFSSLTFLFVFLPLVLLCHYAVPRGARNTVLLFFSIVFYTWGEGFYVLLMLGSVLLNYVGALLAERLHGKPGARANLALFTVANIGLLAAFKYANFLADNLDVLLSLLGLGRIGLAPIHLPIGISFYTFQAFSYLIDVHRREVPAQRNPFDLALYVTMFPQLIAGPIVRYQDVAREIARRVVERGDFAYGVRRFVVGLGKKVLLANVLARSADLVFGLPVEDLSASAAWLGVVSYAFQIYFDFSGYSDMAIGLGHMFAFRFLENFDYPYTSQSIQEFWRRWHISLSTWFRDYLYIPLGGGRRGPLRVYLNLVTVFFLCGLWHGAHWNFVLWGLHHGLFLVLERLGLGTLLARLPRPLRHAYVLLVVLVGWVLFRAADLSAAVAYLDAMFGGSGAAAQPASALLDREQLFTLCAATLASLPLAPAPFWRASSPANARRAGVAGLRLAFLGTVFAASVLYLTAGTYNPFIYFRF